MSQWAKYIPICLNIPQLYTTIVNEIVSTGNVPDIYLFKKGSDVSMTGGAGPCFDLKWPYFFVFTFVLPLTYIYLSTLD